MSDDRPKPPTAWLQHLHNAGHWERLVQIGAECLAVDPHETQAHFHRAWALLRLDRTEAMRPHMEFLLREDAEDVRVLQLAAMWHIEGRRWKQARAHLDAALQRSPEEPNLWHLKACLEARQSRLRKARECSARARQLAPDDANIAHLDVALSSAERTGTAEAWFTVRAYERALALDPENDLLMASMGDVFLDELEMPERAEELYRQALLVAPTSSDHQKRLWNAMQSRNLLFRTLRLPISGAIMIANICRGLMRKPWLVLVLLIGFKFVLAFLVWLFLAAVLFAPPTWLVEFLVLADIQRASRAASKLGGWWMRFHQLPFAIRLTLCMGLIVVFWYGVFALAGIPVLAGVAFIGLFFLANLAMLAVRIALRKSDARRGRRKAAAKPPPLPAIAVGTPSARRVHGQSPPLPGDL